MIATVTDVQMIKGTSKKTGKPYTMYKVATDSDIEASSFDLLEVGDEVELSKNGVFWNAKKVEIAKAEQRVEQSNQQIGFNELNEKLDRILKGLAEIHKEVVPVKDDLEVE